MSYKPGDIARHPQYGTVKIEGGPWEDGGFDKYVVRTEDQALTLMLGRSLTPEPDELPAGTLVRNMGGVELTVVAGPFGVSTNHRPWYVVRNALGCESTALRDRLTVVSLPKSEPGVGDHVRITDPDSIRHGLVGRLTHITARDDGLRYRVETDTGGYWWAREVERVS